MYYIITRGEEGAFVGTGNDILAVNERKRFD